MREWSVYARLVKPRCTETAPPFYVETIHAETKEQAERIFQEENWCLHPATFEVLIAPLIQPEAECPK